MKENEVTFKFKNKDQANSFISWFNGQGEQDYWDYSEIGNYPFAENFIYNYNEITGE